MRLANAFCRYLEMANTVEVVVDPGNELAGYSQQGRV
jgi:hypothetical protein